MSAIVKVCGLRRPQDARLCLDLGARFLGCVVAKDSPRCATPAEVERIAALARGHAPVVLVFRGASAEEILATCAATGVRRVQIHGTSPQACRLLRFHGILVHPVFRVRPEAARLPAFDPLPTADVPAILDGGPGGAGVRFRWQLLSAGTPPATLVAGGITPDNVAELLAHEPFGIDVSSGVEAAPGVKDHAALRDLFAAVGSATGRVVS